MIDDGRRSDEAHEEANTYQDVVEGDNTSAALRRVVQKVGNPHIIDTLTDQLAGADLTTLLLEVMRRRSLSISPAELVRSYDTSRFVTPAAVPYAELRKAETSLLRRLPSDFDLIALAPVLPLGSHSALAPVDQNKVISTVRGSEVAADPTNGLALEGATRRRSLRKEARRSAEQVKLAAFQRVVRAQRFEGAANFAHFELMGLVTAGRDRGDFRFERDSAVEHITYATEAVLETGADSVRIALTDFTAGSLARVCDQVRDALSDLRQVDVVDRPDREDGRGYYQGFCFKTFATFREHELEIADGGLVDWTAQLLQDRKERLFISGLGVDRLAVLFRED